MSYSAPIASKTIASEQPFIVFSHTAGLVGTAPSLSDAFRIQQVQLARSRERGHELNAFVFQWLNGSWVLCSNLYDLEAERGARFRGTPDALV